MENYQIAKNVILVVYCAHKQNKIVYNAIILIDIMILLYVLALTDILKNKLMKILVNYANIIVKLAYHHQTIV